MINKCDQLLPELQQRASDAIDAANNRLGLQLFITEAYRTPERQDELYAQGRTKPGAIVTYLKGNTSNHCKRRAFDIVDKQKGYSLSWDTIANVIKGFGFEWGGDFPKKYGGTFIDRPHFEWPESNPLPQAQQQNQSNERNSMFGSPGLTVQSTENKDGKMEYYPPGDTNGCAIARQSSSDTAPQVDVVGSTGAYFARGWTGVIEGASFAPTGQTSDGNWALVRYGNNGEQRGWIKAEFLTAIPNQPEATDTEDLKQQLSTVTGERDSLKNKVQNALQALQ